MSDAPKRGVFVGLRRDRLGARLLMMLNCIRLAEDFETSFRVNWFPQGADAPELDNIDELFDPAWTDTHFLSEVEFAALEQTAQPIWTFENDPDPSRIEAHLAAGHAIILEEGFEVIAFPWEDQEAIRSRYRAFINQIGFSPLIRGYMDKIEEALGQGGSSAYHIRRGDILNGLPWKHSTWPAKIEPEELYDIHLEKEAGKPAIMFSDQPETLGRFTQKFPWLRQIGDFVDLSSLTRAQRDFLELFAMSRADRVVAPIISAFSSAAARISGRQRVMFRDVLTEDEMETANQRLHARLLNGPVAFLNPSEAAHLFAKLDHYLTRQDALDDTAKICVDLVQAGADNAFIPVFQSINALYRRRWREAQRVAKGGLQTVNLWPEDYAALRAVLAVALAGRKKYWSATRNMAQAFWAKPLRGDVVTIFSRLLFRRHFAERLFPPMDWELQRQAHRPYFNSNIYVSQPRLIGRRPCNFDMMLLDWSALSLDQKARRVAQDRSRIKALLEWLDPRGYFASDAPEKLSFEAVAQARLGEDLGACLAQNDRAIAMRPGSALYLKRRADLLSLRGDVDGARVALTDALSVAEGNPFILFELAHFFEGQGDQDHAFALFREAAEADSCTAAIQGAAGHACLRSGDLDAAKLYLTKANKLVPAYKRFANQLDRVDVKLDG